MVEWWLLGSKMWLSEGVEEQLARTVEVEW